jgi:hypothetical protein
MSQIVDNLIAFKILHMLVTPFEDTQAYKLGVIDKKGNPLKKIKDMSQAQKDSYSMLHRLVFRIKKIMSKVPIVNTRLGTLAAAYFLVKECVENDKSIVTIEENFVDLIRKIQQEEILLVDEYLLVEEFLQTLNEDGEGGGIPTNHTGAGVKTDEPIVRKRKFGKFTVKPPVFSRITKGSRSAGLKERIGYGDVEDDIYAFAKQNPNSVVMLENCDTKEIKVVSFNIKTDTLWDKLKCG